MSRPEDPRLRYAVPAAVAVAVLVASVVDPPGTGPPPPGPFGLLPADKYLHALAYAGLAGTLAWARNESAPAALALAAVVAAGYGAGIELVQATLPARSFDLADALANAVGAALGAAGWRVGRPVIRSLVERVGRLRG